MHLGDIVLYEKKNTCEEKKSFEIYMQNSFQTHQIFLKIIEENLCKYLIENVCRMMFDKKTYIIKVNFELIKYPTKKYFFNFL